MKKEYKLGDTVYLKCGVNVIPLVIHSICSLDNSTLYGLSMVFRRGSANETVEKICSATADMFYII